MARTTSTNGTHANGKAATNGKSATRGKKKPASPKIKGPIRYAVVGLGYISQVAVLPAFANAMKNSRLAALVSGDPAKLKVLGEQYNVSALYDYDGFQECVESGEIDAVFIATPNSEHLPFVVAAARAGVHVLCEKPLGVTERECREMIEACRKAGVRLMTAYRLHFEAANLKAIELVRSGEIGTPKLFSSVFTMNVKDKDNIRLNSALGGGPLHDIGIYCINAARSLFRDEPVEVFAMAERSDDPRFREVHETVSCVMRFPKNRLAQFTCSFGAADAGYFHIVGDKGDVCLDPAYEYAEGLGLTLTVDDKTTTREFEKRDQFAAELLHFSRCVQTGREPEPSGMEGLADVRIIRALQRSARTGRPVRLEDGPEVKHPSPSQRIDRPPVRKRKQFHSSAPSGN